MKFNCIKCGECCSNIRGRIDGDEKEFIESNFFGKMPIVQLVPVDKMSLSLWGWEADKLVERAKELGIDAEIKPFRVVFDLKENKSIVISYFLDHDNCPFLKDNECLCYEDRPLVCKQFPIQTVSLEDKPVLAKCPALKDVGVMRREEMKDYFGESYDAAVKNDSVIEWHNMKVMELIKEGKVKPVKDYPFNFLLKRVGNSEKMNFTDYILDKGIADKGEIDKIIK